MHGATGRQDKPEVSCRRHPALCGGGLHRKFWM